MSRHPLSAFRVGDTPTLGPSVSSVPATARAVSASESEGRGVVVPTSLRALDAVFRAHWNFGAHALVGWTAAEPGLAFIVAPALKVFRLAHSHERIVLGRRRMGPRTFAEVADALGVTPERHQFKGTEAAALNSEAIDQLITRYAVTKTRHRAAFLLDIAEFSLFSAEEQAAQLSTLDHSLNIAEERSAELGIATDLARSTTGDGFYAWNRTKGVGADVNLFCVLMLALAHQALQHRRIEEPYVPRIRTCFGRGSHYSFVQHGRSEPAGRDYIVGDLTIGLARLLACTQPSQVLVSEIQYGESGAKAGVENFIRLVADALSDLKDIELGGATVSRIAAYLTGAPRTGSAHRPLPLEFRDKHGFLHLAYNGKVNISLRDDEPIYLGLPETQVDRAGGMVRPRVSLP